jgi:hypothetical protein
MLLAELCKADPRVSQSLCYGLSADAPAPAVWAHYINLGPWPGPLQQTTKLFCIDCARKNPCCVL